MQILLLMEWLIVIYLCLVPVITDAKKPKPKPKLKDKVTALETLFRTEMYLMQEQLEQEKTERENSILSLNETLESLGYQSVDGKTQGAIRCEDKPGDYEKLSMDFDQINVTFGEMKESFTYIGKGIAEEKKARKNNTKVLMSRMNTIEEQQNNTLNMANGELQNTTSDLWSVYTGNFRFVPSNGVTIKTNKQKKKKKKKKKKDKKKKKRYLRTFWKYSYCCDHHENTPI